MNGNYCLTSEFLHMALKFFEKFWLIFLLGILLSSSLGCDAIYRMLQKEGAEEKELVGEVVPFESNPTVEEIQSLLSLYGYSPGKVDGVLGLRTREAIAKFQRDNNLKETRFADQETWAKISDLKDKKLVVEGQLNVKLIQQILEEQGFHPGKVDGKFGPQTTQAVKIFQREYELKIDGKVGYQTLSKFAELIPPQEKKSSP